MTADLVVSLYRDKLDWVGPLQRPGVRVFIIDKWLGGDWPERYADLSREGLTIERRDNRGFCDESYLHHIVERWDDLADWTVFSPDGPQDSLYGASLADALTPGPSLRVPRLYRSRDWGPDGRICWGQLEHTDRSGVKWKDRFARSIRRCDLSFADWMRKYVGFDPDGPDWPGYAPGGVYAVPKKAITYLPRAFYERLRDQLSTAVEPETAHYCERAWVAIWSGLARHIPDCVETA